MIEGKKLVVRQNHNTLLDDVSINIKPGEVLALVGPNGAGKSTLLKTLSGEIKPSIGHVTINSITINQCSTKQMAQQRAVLPQNSTLNFPFTAFEIVIMGRSPHLSGNESSNDIAIANLAIKATKIDHLRDREFTSLSGGEKQRVHLARVLTQIWQENAVTPRYLLLDEPTSALDLAHQHQILAMAKQMARTQLLGVLAILHDLNLAALYADQIGMLRQGQLVYLGSPTEVLSAAAIHEVFGINVDIMQQPYKNAPYVMAHSLLQ